MGFLLDTNICSAYFRNPRDLFQRFSQYSGRLYVSTITYGELYVWAYRQADPSGIAMAIDELMENNNSLPYDLKSAEIFGRIRGEHLQRGISFSPIDLMIASTAFAHDLTLVTHNIKDFNNIPDLRIEDWIAE